MTELKLVMKQGCETCLMIEPLVAEIAEAHNLEVICQDSPDFPADVPVIFDES